MSKTYKTTGQVKHDGKRYGIGEPIELDDEQAAGLKKLDMIEDVKVKAPVAPVAPVEPVKPVAPAAPVVPNKPAAKKQGAAKPAAKKANKS